MLDLPYGEIWVIDFEFFAPPGHRPQPVCLVGRELLSGRLLRLWADELGPEPPFPTDERALFVAYFASAEWSCFLALGWPLPVRILDLFAEFRCETNGLPLPTGRGLLGALSVHGIHAITRDEKSDMRELVMRGGPWTRDERQAILDYCQSDVDCLGPLLAAMLPRLRADRRGLGRALLRGRYTAAVARMEHVGVPIDTDTLALLRGRWDDIKLDLIAAVDREFRVYEGTTFRSGRFRTWLLDEHISWPETSTGRLRLDADTFREMSKCYPQLEPLKELRHALGEMRLEELAVGPDGRNRTLLSPFGARTGRNTPSNTRFIFGPSVWLRSLIKPAPDHAIAYIDWSSQEIAIAAALSGDGALLDAVMSGDPYLAFARRAGLAPPESTKQTHGAIRDACKTVLLGVNYGMGADTLAKRLGCSTVEAQAMLRRLGQTFPKYTMWADNMVDVVQLVGQTSTVLGWTLHLGAAPRPTALRNWPMQAHGAEMLRLACCLVTERGVDVCAPVHDAVLIEAPTESIAGAVSRTRDAMAEASRNVLDGLEITTDVSVTTYPERYTDPRGRVMWERVTSLLAREAAA